jgi:Flp pilus assembly protein TadG
MDRDERGVITAFVVVMSTALIVVAGLVLDGGYTLAARRQAIDEADGAARAAAQAVAVSTRNGTVMLDPQRAQASVDAYLAPTGHHGQVSVHGDVVTVAVSFSRRMLILGVGGLVSVRVTGRGTARAVPGIANAEGG